MSDAIQPIAELLRAARQQKGLSQRELGRRVGLPQSHISKIESAAVDLQTSSLIELARALELELTLVPRTLLPAVQALQRTSGFAPQSSAQRSRATDLASTNVPAYELDAEGGDA